jgi:hypothetical protein
MLGADRTRWSLSHSKCLLVMVVGNKWCSTNGWQTRFLLGPAVGGILSDYTFIPKKWISLFANDMSNPSKDSVSWWHIGRRPDHKDSVHVAIPFFSSIESVSSNQLVPLPFCRLPTMQQPSLWTPHMPRCRRQRMATLFSWKSPSNQQPGRRNDGR